MESFKPHSKKQSVAIRSALDPKIKITACITGLQWGKTVSGAMWLLLRVHAFPHTSNNFIVTAPTYKILNQATIPAFMEVFQGMGEYGKVDATFKITGGGTVYFRTQTDPDSVIGMTNVQGIWADEAGKYTRYFWENIEGRAALKNCPIIITTTPYSLNWMYRDIIVPVREEKRDDILLIGAKSRENPYFSQEVFYKRQKEMNPRKFKAMYCGEFEQMQGLVYDCFSEEENIIDPHDVDLFTGTKFYGGVDWGYNDPFVLTVRAVTPDGRHYQVSEFYKSGMILSEILQLCKMKQQVYDIRTFYCDPSQPGHIDAFNREGLIAVKANNDIDLGVEKHYELIKTRKYKIFEGSSPNTLDELSVYHWPEPKDLLPDQDQKPIKPVDQNNHCMDANRYVTIMTTSNSGVKKSPKLPVSQRRRPRFNAPRKHNKIRYVRDSEDW